MTSISHAIYDKKGLSLIGEEVKSLPQKAKEDTLKPEDYEGGTFTLSNLGGPFGIKQLCAIVNPPQAAILAIGTAEKKVVPGSAPEQYDISSFMSQCSAVIIVSSMVQLVHNGLRLSRATLRIQKPCYFEEKLQSSFMQLYELELRWRFKALSPPILNPRHRFLPIFKDIAAQDLIEMDQQDAASGREEIFERVKSAYTQNDWVYYRNSSSCRHLILNDEGCSMDTESLDMEPGIKEGGSRDTKSPAIEPGEKQSPMVNGSVEKPLEVNIELSDQPRSPMIERKEEVKCLEQNGKQSPGKEEAKSVEGDPS